jgi:hypothetical protein
MGVPLYEICIRFLDTFWQLKCSMKGDVICSYCAFEDIITFTGTEVNFFSFLLFGNTVRDRL